LRGVLDAKVGDDIGLSTDFNVALSHVTLLNADGYDVEKLRLKVSQGDSLAGMTR
jgi:hypothetical protein